MKINVTEIAAKHINLCIRNRGKGIGLRIGIKIKGCSGMSYELEYVDLINKKEHE